MTLALRPLRVASGAGNEEGCLVLDDGRLVAVLVHLTGATYAELTGRWYLEAGFGQLDGAEQPTFADLEKAQQWISFKLAGSPRRPRSTTLH